MDQINDFSDERNKAFCPYCGLTPDEMDSFWRLMRCDWCGQPLREVEPGSWLCPGCSLLKEVAPPPSVRYVKGMLLLETRRRRS